MNAFMIIKKTRDLNRDVPAEEELIATLTDELLTGSQREQRKTPKRLKLPPVSPLASTTQPTHGRRLFLPADTKLRIEKFKDRVAGETAISQANIMIETHPQNGTKQEALEATLLQRNIDFKLKDLQLLFRRMLLCITKTFIP
ncbi:uncharacterized protein LOC110442056 [Mizuhopecten yessoensis]|uniref:uncharacterized protein LOC110442056 n=1 Tax=Mizuhopecten yessoensis TaxID=6573 RepID=UPI000B4573BD|nr:uncharacterized protein LOC110442056 [Mizuhopecten yessoensis]